MSTVFTFPGKCGDAILQWPVAFHWARQTGEKFTAWLDVKTCKPLVSLFESQACVERVELRGGVENYGCGGQPFHMNLSTSDFSGHTIYHLGLRAFPVRQITLQTLNDARVPVTISPEDLAATPVFDVGVPSNGDGKRRLLIHGQGVCPHNRQTPAMWKFLASVRGELESLFDEIEFVGSEEDIEVGLRTYPDWGSFSDGGDFLALARRIASSTAMIGCGSAPITLAGALKVPAIRVHDRIGEDAPKVIWSNLGEGQVNDTELGLRTEWPKFRDRWLKVVDSTAQTP